MHTHYRNLYAANDPCFGVNSPMGNPFPVPTPHSWTFQSRGPWLAGRLCCPARSMLTTTSSETLIPSRRLIFFVLTGLGLTVSYRLETRGSPIYSTYLFHRATSGTPTFRLAANSCSFANRSSFRHLRIGSANASRARRFSRGSCNEAASSSLSLRPDGLLALHRQGLLLPSLRLARSPLKDVEYNYTGKQPIPATGLTPARHAALWAANEDHKGPEVVATASCPSWFNPPAVRYPSHHFPIIGRI